MRFFLAALGILGAIEYCQAQDYICKPTAFVSEKPCPNGEHVQYFLRATNACSCPADIRVAHPDGSTSVLSVKAKETEEKWDMIGTCGPKRTYGTPTHVLRCPQNVESAPKPPPATKPISSPMVDRLNRSEERNKKMEETVRTNRATDQQTMKGILQSREKQAREAEVEKARQRQKDEDADLRRRQLEIERIREVNRRERERIRIELEDARRRQDWDDNGQLDEPVYYPPLEIPQQGYHSRPQQRYNPPQQQAPPVYVRPQPNQGGGGVRCKDGLRGCTGGH